MAKQKRASLKDKSPETLGLTQKKGKGMDLLFGGGSDKEQAAVNQSGEASETAPGLSGVPDILEPAATQPTGANGDLIDELGLPVALEAPPDDLILASTPPDPAVDELGLPVALEAPPDDLILASAPPDLAVDELGLPVALEAPPDDLVLASTPPDPAVEGEAELAPSMPAAEMAPGIGSPDDPNGLSDFVRESDPPLVEEEKAPGPEEPDIPSDILIQDTLAVPIEQDDLSGLVQESDLSGLISEIPPDPAYTDLSGLVVDMQNEPEPMPVPESDPPGLPVDAPMASAPPVDFSIPVSSPTETPLDAPAPPFQPEVAPVMPDGYSTTPYPEASPMSAADYAQPYPTEAPVAPPPAPSATQVSRGPDLSAFQEIPITQDKFKPQDELPSYESDLVIKEITLAERDDNITRQVLEYVGRERLDKLFNEIESLYDQVEAELSEKDANFALDTLRQAHHLLLENPREYDEAFYRVAIVKTILKRKANVAGWSYSWGLFVLLYGVLWLAACLAGGFYIVIHRSDLLSPGTALPFQSMFCAFAGGIGGCVAVLWTLYYRVSIKQDFDRQHLMFYLVKPILGFILGLVMFFLLISASSIGAAGNLQLGFDTGAGVALACLLGFIAGFRQDNVYDWIYVIIKTISPKTSEEAHTKTPLVPPDIAAEYEQQIEAKEVKVTLS